MWLTQAHWRIAQFSFQTSESKGIQSLALKRRKGPFDSPL